ncbi:MAG: hypothetical protein C5B50_08380 [Verrucomicrobia bacterium]|nr:MAG: hypothetical protein C5B50_08380 [Verrucomicrobiota bacterium]
MLQRRVMTVNVFRRNARLVCGYPWRGRKRKAGKFSGKKMEFKIFLPHNFPAFNSVCIFLS